MSEQEKYSLEEAAEEAAELQDYIKSGGIRSYNIAERNVWLRKMEIQQAELEKAAQSPEVEKRPPLLLVYRDNELFAEYIPDIVSELRSAGRRVEIQSFPAGTEVKTIQKQLYANADIARGREVLSDTTLNYSVRYIDFRVMGVEQKTKDSRIGKLDELFDEATRRVMAMELFDIETAKVLQSKGMLSEAISLEKADGFFIALIKNILSVETRRPEKVSIVLQNIADHAPFIDLLAEERKTLGEGHHGSPQLHQVILVRVKKWLIEAGIAEGTIQIQDINSDLREIDKEKSWLIVDRHAAQRLPELRQAVLLELPLVNFFTDASKRGLLTVTNPQAFREELTAVFKREFIPPIDQSKP